MKDNKKSTENVEKKQIQEVEKENVIVEENLNEDKNNNQEGKKRNVLGVVLIAAIIIILVIGLGYKVVSNNPTNILKNSINNAYKDFKDELKDYDKKKNDFNITKDTFKINGDIELSGDYFKDLKDNKISFVAGLDYPNKLIEGEATLEEDGKNLLNATVWNKDDKLYIKSNNLFDNTYVMDDFNFEEEFDLSELEDLMEEMNEVSTDDIDYLVKEFKDALIKSLDKDEMTKEKETIDINDISVKTTKISYNIDKTSTKELMTSLSDILVENDEFVSKLAKLTDVEKNDIKDSLKELKDKENYEDMPKGEFNVYLTGINNKAVKIELKLDTVTLSYSEYKDNVYALISEKQSNTKIEVIGKTEKKVTDIEVKYNKEKIATLTIRQFDEEGIDLDYNINIEDVIEAKGSLKITSKEKSKTEYDGVIEFSINGNINGEELDFGIKMNYTIKTGEKIADYDTNEAIPEDDITEEDKKKLEDALEELKNSGFGTLFKDLSLDLPTDDNNNDKNNDKNNDNNDELDIYDDYECWNAYYKDENWDGTYKEYYNEYCAN